MAYSTSHVFERLQVRFMRTNDRAPLFSLSLESLQFGPTRYAGVHEMNVSTTLLPDEQVRAHLMSCPHAEKHGWSLVVLGMLPPK